MNWKMFRETVIIMIKKKTSRQIVELLKTMEQGIKHLDKKLAEGEVRENLYLFTDLLEAFTTIETLIYKNEEVKEETAELKRAFSLITESYEQENYGQLRSYFIFGFKKSFEAWFKKVMVVYND